MLEFCLLKGHFGRDFGGKTLACKPRCYQALCSAFLVKSNSLRLGGREGGPFSELEHVRDSDWRWFPQDWVGSNSSTKQPVNAVQGPGSHHNCPHTVEAVVYQPLWNPIGNTIFGVTPTDTCATFKFLGITLTIISTFCLYRPLLCCLQCVSQCDSWPMKLVRNGEMHTFAFPKKYCWSSRHGLIGN